MWDGQLDSGLTLFPFFVPSFSLSQVNVCELHFPLIIILFFSRVFNFLFHALCVYNSEGEKIIIWRMSGCKDTLVYKAQCDVRYSNFTGKTVSLTDMTTVDKVMVNQSFIYSFNKCKNVRKFGIGSCALTTLFNRQSFSSSPRSGDKKLPHSCNKYRI